MTHNCYQTLQYYIIMTLFQYTFNLPFIEIYLHIYLNSRWVLINIFTKVKLQISLNYVIIPENIILKLLK